MYHVWLMPIEEDILLFKGFLPIFVMSLIVRPFTRILCVSEGYVTYSQAEFRRHLTSCIVEVASAKVIP